MSKTGCGNWTVTNAFTGECRALNENETVMTIGFGIDDFANNRISICFDRGGKRVLSL